MSGRAGRRGKDERGICIIMIDEQVVFDLSLPIIFIYDMHQIIVASMLVLEEVDSR